MICDCGLSNRSRLLLYYINKFKLTYKNKKNCFYENNTPLTKKFDSISENKSYQSVYTNKRNHALFQDMTKSTYKSNFFDAVIHNDVLEHIPNYKQALYDNQRILKKNGILIFTAPFFGMRHNVIRAKIDKEGKIKHLMKEIYHGDPLNPKGILAFYEFGWDLYNDLVETGFSTIRLCVNYDLISGFLSNFCPVKNKTNGSKYGNMLPCVFVAIK
ncbi:methyltransferase domain-containing protein [Thermodesulfobacteriota bacterium]